MPPSPNFLHPWSASCWLCDFGRILVSCSCSAFGVRGCFCTVRFGLVSYRSGICIWSVHVDRGVCGALHVDWAFVTSPPNKVVDDKYWHIESTIWQYLNSTLQASAFRHCHFPMINAVMLTYSPPHPRAVSMPIHLVWTPFVTTQATDPNPRAHRPSSVTQQ